MSTDDFLVLGRDLTALARAGRLDPVVGRERELDEVLRILCRRSKSNPLLLGEPGVGKTALVEGLAQLMISSAVPAQLRSRRLFELQLGSLLAGTQYRGDLEKRLQNLIEAARREKTIVFIDEIHLLVVAGRGSGMDAANLLKPVLARGEVPCIGATTKSEAVDMFKIDPAMERRFQPVLVQQPGPETVLSILKAIRPRLEHHHQLTITDDAIEAAVALSIEHQADRKNPDRAIDILEDACAGTQLRIARLAANAGEEDPVLAKLRGELQTAIQELDLDRHVKVQEEIEEFVNDSATVKADELRTTIVVGAEEVRGAITLA